MARVAHCLRTPIRSTVDVLHSPSRREAIYRGLQTCGSVWDCPVCAARISEHRRKELTRAVSAWKEMGGRVILITYTLRHKASDSLRATLDGLLNARKRLRSGRSNVSFSSREGMIGSCRALEVTHSPANGWHPHIHELVFIGSDTSTQELESDIRARWSKIVVSLGLRDVNDHSVKVQDTTEAVADYIAKFGHEPSWTAEHELTKAVVKRGRQESRGPMGLLEDYVLGDKQAGVLWQEYSEVFKGKKQLVWSPGLRDLLIPEPEQTDEEIAGDVSEYPVLLATLSLEQWRVIVANDARAEVLQVAGTGDAAALWEYVFSLVSAADRVDRASPGLPVVCATCDDVFPGDEAAALAAGWVLDFRGVT